MKIPNLGGGPAKPGQGTLGVFLVQVGLHSVLVERAAGADVRGHPLHWRGQERPDALIISFMARRTHLLLEVGVALLSFHHRKLYEGHEH